MKVGFQERPSGTNQHDQREQGDSFQEAEDVEQHVPAVRASGALDVRLVLGFADEVQSLEDEHGEHEEVDSEHGQSLLVEHGDPDSGEDEVDQREDEVNPREHGLPGGEIVPATALPVEIVHRRGHVHRDREPTLETVREQEGVLIGVVFLENGVKLLRGFERVEGVDRLDEVGEEGAGDLAVLELLAHVHPGFEGAEEEPDPVEFEVRVGERDRGHVELQAAPVREPELVEGDYAPVVGSDVREADLRQRNRHGEEEQER